jgi:protein scribble
MTPFLSYANICRAPFFFLRFSIAGGKGHTSFVDGSDGIYVSRLTEGGIAQRDGKIQVGDRIVAVC